MYAELITQSTSNQNLPVIAKHFYITVPNAQLFQSMVLQIPIQQPTIRSIVEISRREWKTTANTMEEEYQLKEMHFKSRFSAEVE